MKEFTELFLMMDYKSILLPLGERLVGWSMGIENLILLEKVFIYLFLAFYWIKSEQLFLELTFNPAKKGFFSVGKQEQPVDYFEGYICKVKK